MSKGSEQDGSTVPAGPRSADTYLKEIQLTDWRQYRGTVPIDLAPNGQQHMNAIIGENGTGKTSLAKAVSACLNGTVPGEVEEDGEPYVNSEEMCDLEQGETKEGRITLRLTHEGTDYDISRAFRSTKRDVGCENVIDDELTVERYVPSRGGWKTVENPSAMLSRILPPEVQRYYFFDGERLDQLFEPGYEARVRTAVRELSHIEVLENGIEHLGTLRDERRRRANSSSGEVAEASSALKERQGELIEVAHTKALVERDIQAKADALEAVEDRMGAAADPKVLELFAERQGVEARIDGLQDEEDELEAQLKQHLVEAGTINLAMAALDDATAQLDWLDASGHLPPDIRRSFLTTLLEEEKECICGCDLEKHPNRRREVEELRDSTPGIGDRTIEASYEFPKTQVAGRERFQALREAKRERREIRRERLDLETKREGLTGKLRAKDIPDDVDLEALDEQRERLRAELQQLRTRNGRLEEKLETTNSKVQAAQQRVDKEIAKDDRSARISREVEFYKRARRELQAIKDDLMDQVREDIETSLDAYYNDLTWKDEPYDLSLDDEFGIHIEGPEGLRQVDRLSAGETELLALSFIAALTEVSGFDAPVLIDTPVGRIDKEHRDSIASKLPTYLAGHQVTFLFTDSEYDDVIAGALDGHLAHKHKLQNDNRVTTVIDYDGRTAETDDA